jgi:hypothetical protein
VLDPEEIAPAFREPALLIDVETKDSIEVSPEYARGDYRQKIQHHMETLAARARAAGLDYFLLNTSRPLDEGLREYLAVRQGRM